MRYSVQIFRYTLICRYIEFTVSTTCRAKCCTCTFADICDNFSNMFACNEINTLTCATGLGHIDVVFDVALDVFGLELTVV